MWCDGNDMRKTSEKNLNQDALDLRWRDEVLQLKNFLVGRINNISFKVLLSLIFKLVQSPWSEICGVYAGFKCIWTFLWHRVSVRFRFKRLYFHINIFNYLRFSVSLRHQNFPVSVVSARLRTLRHCVVFAVFVNVIGTAFPLKKFDFICPSFQLMNVMFWPVKLNQRSQDTFPSRI